MGKVDKFLFILGMSIMLAGPVMLTIGYLIHGEEEMDRRLLEAHLGYGEGK